jgi:hypothetical protein
MTSAALDACLCLLLISAAAITVTSAPASSPDWETDRADAVAETLTAETADVVYTLRPVPGSDGNPEANPEYDRLGHGTLASLLADAAIRTVRVDGNPLTGTNEGFAAAVRETVAQRLPDRTRVVVRWEPYPGSHLGRTFAVGPTPPTNADVNAATVRAPSGVSSLEGARAASAGGYHKLGRVVAESLVDGLLPPEKGRLALGDDAPVSGLVQYRYRRASEAYGVETADAIERGDTRAANDRITAAMADRVAEELRRGTENPGTAVESLELDTVEISVRTWSP